jgi:hypothetical protein
MTTTEEMLEALYAILNDPSRSASRARLDARTRIRVYKAELAARQADQRPASR